MQAITEMMNESVVGVYLLHFKFSQAPFHLLGGGPNPSSLKDADSGQIPVSITPTMMSLSNGKFRFTLSGKLKKSHDLVVLGCKFLLGNTETTPLVPAYKNGI